MENTTRRIKKYQFQKKKNTNENLEKIQKCKKYQKLNIAPGPLTK